METSSFSSAQLFQDFPGNFQSRKLFLDNHLNQQPVMAAAPPYPGESSSLHKSVVLILVAAVICSLGLNILIICALVKCRRFVASESNSNSSSPSVRSGIKKKSLKNFPVVKYSTELKIPGLDSECVICLSEFVAGEHVRILPKCSHGFHVRCIDKWLKSHTSCPKCRHFLIETCEKIVACSVDGTSGTSVPVPETVVSIRPLEPEGIIHNSGGLG